MSCGFHCPVFVVLELSFTFAFIYSSSSYVRLEYMGMTGCTLVQPKKISCDKYLQGDASMNYK